MSSICTSWLMVKLAHLLLPSRLCLLQSEEQWDGSSLVVLMRRHILVGNNRADIDECALLLSQGGAVLLLLHVTASLIPPHSAWLRWW